MELALVGDVGGTHARLGLIETADASTLRDVRTYACADYESLDALLVAYLAEIGERAGRPGAIAIAAAGPVEEGVVRFTNLPWTVSRDSLRAAGFELTEVVNDFEALALGAPRLTAEDLEPIGTAVATPGRTLAVLGPGTGFGVAAVCRDALGSAILVSEGGHAGWAPHDETDLEVWRILARRFGRVSIERVLSGPGLVNLYHALCELRGEAAQADRAEQVTAAANAGDGAAAQAVERFSIALGAVAGDFALAYGAQGGVYLAGGVTGQLRGALHTGGFRAGFEAKGRLTPYVAAIPTAIVLHPALALLGAAESLRRTWG